MEVYGLSIGPHNVSTAFTSICSGLAGTKVCTKRKEHIMEHCCLIQHCLMLDIPRPFWGPSYSVSTEVFWCCVALRELHPKTAGWYGFASTWGTPSNPIYVVYRLVLCWECVSLGYTCLDKHIQTHIHSVWTEDPVMCSRGNILNSKLKGPTCGWVFFWRLAIERVYGSGKATCQRESNKNWYRRAEWVAFLYVLIVRCELLL